MIIRHTKTGETRQIVPGVKYHDDWKPVAKYKEGRATISIAEVDPKHESMSVKKSKPAKKRLKLKNRAEDDSTK